MLNLFKSCSSGTGTIEFSLVMALSTTTLSITMFLVHIGLTSGIIDRLQQGYGTLVSTLS